MNYELTLQEVEQHVISFFDAHLNEHLVYHNRAHTENVVKAATEIANHFQLNERDYFIVVTAAWFHDIGYFINVSEHEAVGATEADKFLQSKGADADTIKAIMQCILATRKNTQPEGLLQKIVCDADLYQLGTDDFSKNNSLIRNEFIAIHHLEISKQEWRKKTIEFLQNHQYHTDYCRLLLTDTKMKNLDNLKEKIAKKEKPVINEPLKQVKTITMVEDPEKTNIRPTRGIETMFRISSSNHQRLSDMADSKANIMISVNSIIMSVLLSVMLRNLSQYPHLTVPVILLVTVNVLTIVLSILATRPSIPNGTFTQEDVKEKKVNLLFFGNYYRMPQEDYTSGMKQMMEDKDFLYGSLIKDGYSQGIVLGRKYNLLRVSYNVFMFGLIASVLAFLIASLFFQP